MRAVFVAGACAWLGCTHVSSSDYGVAAGFAAAAGAVQVAELANNGPSARSCNRKTCSGCCDWADRCVDGTADDACGTDGAVCRDCIANGQHACGGDGACSSELVVGGTAGASAAPRVKSSTPAQAPIRPCNQVLVLCFAGTHSVCTTEPSGCSLCSCTPNDPIPAFGW